MPPDDMSVDARAFYDDGERAAFAADRSPRPSTSTSGGPALGAPVGLTAVQEAGGVSLAWTAASSQQELAASLPPDQRLGWRVYRSVAEGNPVQVASLQLGATRWRDQDLPLAATTVAYEVWAVLLRELPAGPTLVAAERSGLVTVAVPDHFQLVLVDGDPGSVRLRVEVGPASAPVAAQEAVLRPGEPLLVGDRATGLVLARIEVVDEERLVTRERLVFASDGSLVLDPVTRRPRTTETQVLMPARRLIATLTDRLGASRTLELDLP